MSQLSTTPDTIEIGSTESKTPSINFAPDLNGATIVSIAATLTNIETGASHAAGLSTRTNTATTVLQRITALVAGSRYRLVVTVTATDGEVTAAETLVVCPI
jgi:hypothetical protein